MRASEKIRSDLDRAFPASGSGTASARGAESARRFIAASLGFVPEASREAILDSFLSRLQSDRDAAVAWLGTLCGIFLQDYDGSALGLEDWEELRDIVNEGAGEIDIDLLTYVMSLVVDHGAL